MHGDWGPHDMALGILGFNYNKKKSQVMLNIAHQLLVDLPVLLVMRKTGQPLLHSGAVASPGLDYPLCRLYHGSPPPAARGPPISCQIFNTLF